MSLLALAVVVIAVLELTNTTHLFHQPSVSTKVVVAGKPVEAPAVKKSQTPVKKAPAASAGSKVESGGAIDTQGTTSGSSNPDHWVTSASGVITVKSPAPNSTLHSGDTIAGSAKTSQVNYRLKDNRVGQVAAGSLSVVNGNFSGIIHFTPQGTGGQLDIFTTNDQGVEYNEVQINLAF